VKVVVFHCWLAPLALYFTGMAKGALLGSTLDGQGPGSVGPLVKTGTKALLAHWAELGPPLQDKAQG